jgi:hypothetical protein
VDHASTIRVAHIKPKLDRLCYNKSSSYKTEIRSTMYTELEIIYDEENWCFGSTSPQQTLWFENFGNMHLIVKKVCACEYWLIFTCSNPIF